ncbi:hypothetical protein MON38_01280 [Hymenobacter sp. DH14]|uniref:Uncharacterized protein n=1 Tax=Hymenobacter cyanobacteriorum TaxID=2926463 RepID=A0A9X1VDC5_9BACT|nr:hypothetical protein [Hymenobacter cyanobacteriorum]MCI1186033.1 hypothetical protein [Hymenobacter cyanobacteriorum]
MIAEPTAFRALLQRRATLVGLSIGHFKKNMRQLYVLVAVLFFIVRAGFGQSYQQFRLNAGVQAATADKQAILAVWDRYLGSGFRHQSQYWAPAELKRYPQADLLLSEGYVHPNVFQYTTQKLLLSIEPLDSTHYQCRTLFYWQNPADTLRQITTFCILNTQFERAGPQWLLVNHLTSYTRAWPARTVGRLVYRFPPGYRFNQEQARQADDFLTNLFRDFAIPPFPVTYYIATDCAEVHRMKGFDYVVGMGGDTVCGFYDEVNHLVYAGGLSEGYLHELVHVINPYFPKAHPLLLTGYSALRGGHFGQPLVYHKKRTLEYLATHAVDLENPLTFTTLDEKTNPQYVVGGIICEAALRAGGLPKLKKLFTYGTSDEDFYTALRQEFGLNREDIPAFIAQSLRAQ